jgi:hypothetical protein
MACESLTTENTEFTEIFKDFLRVLCGETDGKP